MVLRSIVTVDKVISESITLTMFLFSYCIHISITLTMFLFSYRIHISESITLIYYVLVFLLYSQTITAGAHNDSSSKWNTVVEVLCSCIADSFDAWYSQFFFTTFRKCTVFTLLLELLWNSCELLYCDYRIFITLQKLLMLYIYFEQFTIIIISRE